MTTYRSCLTWCTAVSAAEEVDDLDEVLNESIAASIGSKKKAAAELENQGKRKRHRDDDLEDDL